MTWIEADILGINLTPNLYNAPAQAIVNVSWVNNREASELRRHCAHYDVIVMSGKSDPERLKQTP